MNSIQDMMEAEREAYANGYLKTSKLLLECIQIAEYERDTCHENENALSNQMTDACDALEDISSQIDEVIKKMDH